jgi:hypothetical protein
MRVHTISLINSIALIPFFIGIVLIFCYSGIKKENKIVAHISILLTLIILIGLIKPFIGTIDRADNLAVFRVSVMVLTTLVSTIFFVKSFINARKNREKNLY